MDTAKDKLDTAPRAILLKNYTAPAYFIDSVDLHFELDPENTRVSNRMHVTRNASIENTSSELELDGCELELVSIHLNGKQLNDKQYRLSDDNKLLILQAPDEFELTIETLIHPASNTALEGLYVSSGMFCTQCEAEGFRRITYFQDRPDVMARYTTTLVADKTTYPILLSNGNLIEQGVFDDGRHWAKWQDPFPKPSYLFALVAGNLICKQDNFTTASGRSVDLHLYVEPVNQDKCDHALASLKQAMHWDEVTYGREYDLDIFMIVAVNDFNMGAMENKGLNIFNSACVLASPETATDADFYTIQSIIGHEYFHNWSGNRVTCRDWFQLSLKEGFTVFRDQEFSADLNSRPVKRIADVNVLRTHQFAQDAGPMAHPVRPESYIEISNFYTVTIYNKGAEVVRMLHTLLGKEGFRKGTDLYFQRHDGQAVTTDDFVSAMETANEKDFSQFKRWYSQAGTPVIDVTEQYDNQKNIYTLTLQQHCPATSGQADKQAFHIPLSIALLDNKGNPYSLQLDNETSSASTQRVIELKDENQDFTFTNINQQPVLSINRSFSAPVKIKQVRTHEALAFLLARDNDAFNRWDAGQELCIAVLLELIQASQQGKTLALTETVSNAFAALLEDDKLDPALLVQMLTLPSESYLADQCEIVDVDAIHTAREFMRKTLATQLTDQLLAHYHRCCNTDDYHFDADSMANRSLKNLCLAYLMETNDKSAQKLCLDQLHQANNMTDSLTALSTLAQHDIPERNVELEKFYTHWQQDPLVIDKWFAIQASSRLPKTLEHVKSLLKHPAFAMTNPNNVRAVIGRFCHGNSVRFHASDGSGYRFLADQVIALDSLNPQISARLVSAMSRWRRFDEKRQTLMQSELERILKTETLSKDVYEIVSKSLQKP